MIQTKPLIKHGWLRALLYFLGLLLLVMFLPKLISSVVDQISSDKQIVFMLSYAGLSVFVILFTWIMRRFVDRESFFSMGFSWRNYRNDAGIGAFTALAILGLGTLLLIWQNHIAFTGVDFNPASLFIQLVLMLVVAFSEEIMFRGYILNNLMGSMNKYVAVIITAIVFGLVHATNPGATVLPLVNVFLAGLLLGCNYVYTRNLWFAIFFHFVWNFTQGAILGYEVSGTESKSLLQQFNSGNLLWTGGEFGFEGSAVCTALLLIFTIILTFLFYRKYEPSI